METSGRQTVEYKTPFYIMVKRFSCPLMMHHNVFYCTYSLRLSLSYKKVFFVPAYKINLLDMI